jgi:hypothetical protein
VQGGVRNALLGCATEMWVVLTLTDFRLRKAPTAVAEQKGFIVESRVHLQDGLV